jgi:hypothetical protein
MKPVPEVTISLDIAYPQDNGASPRTHDHREFTLDEVALRKVLAHFNPSDNEWVTLLKIAHAFAINCVMQAPVEVTAMPSQPGDPPGSQRAQPNGFAMRCKAIALNHLETSQMFSVKALFAEA